MGTLDRWFLTASSNRDFNNWAARENLTFGVGAKAISMEGFWEEGSIMAVLEPVCGAFDVVDSVGAFILFLQLH